MANSGDCPASKEECREAHVPDAILDRPSKWPEEDHVSQDMPPVPVQELVGEQVCNVKVGRDEASGVQKLLGEA